MRFEKPVPVQWIADFINAELIGNKNGEATGINEIHKVEKGDIVFVDHPKYYATCINSAADYIIINKHTDFPAGKALLVVFSQPPNEFQNVGISPHPTGKALKIRE